MARRQTTDTKVTLKRLGEIAYELKCKQFPNVPTYAVVKPKFSDKTANGLTTCILFYLNHVETSCFAYRVNNTGIYDARKKTYRTSNTVKGIADITAVQNGKFYQIEVKAGRDRLSEHQKKFGQKVHQAGGVYLVAKSFNDFKKKWNNRLQPVIPF